MLLHVAALLFWLQVTVNGSRTRAPQERAHSQSVPEEPPALGPLLNSGLVLSSSFMCQRESDHIRFIAQITFYFNVMVTIKNGFAK